MLALNWQDYVWSPEGLVILVSAVIGAIVVPQLAKKWAAQADALPERGEGETLVLRAAPASRVTYLALAIVTAVGAVASIVIGWGVAQYPDILVDEMTIDQAAGARPTLIGLIIVFGFAAVTAVPAMLWLFVLVNQDEWQRDTH